MRRVIGLRDALGHRAVPADDAAGQRGCTGRGYAVKGAVGFFAGYAEPQKDDEASYGAGNGRGGEDRDGDHLSNSLVNASDRWVRCWPGSPGRESAVGLFGNGAGERRACGRAGRAPADGRADAIPCKCVEKSPR